MTVRVDYTGGEPGGGRVTTKFYGIDAREHADALNAHETAIAGKRSLTARIGTVATSATPTPDAGAHDQYNVTALAVAATFGAPTGTASDGQKLMLRVKDDGTARALAFNAVYRAVGVTLPTTTVVSKTLYVGCVFNGADSVWDVLAVGQQA